MMSCSAASRVGTRAATPQTTFLGGRCTCTHRPSRALTGTRANVTPRQTDHRTSVGHRSGTD
jgi:hypothetical protein